MVFNHKLGADEKEQVHVFKVDANNRNDIDDRASTRWPTPASPSRPPGVHSEFIWDYTCFSGVDYVEQPDDKGVFKIANDYGDDGWNDQVDDEKATTTI